MRSDEFHLQLTACPGDMKAYGMRGDDLTGMIAIAEGLHKAGLTVFLRDTEQDVLVASSYAGCECCHNEHKCGDFLDVADEQANAEFWKQRTCEWVNLR